MEIRTIRGNTAYLDAQQLIGLYRTDERHCILLDCGPAAAWKPSFVSFLPSLTTR